MSGYGDERRREARDYRGGYGGRRRSISPRDDRRGAFPSGGRGGRGGRGGLDSGRGGGSGGYSFRSTLPDLPINVPIPSTGRKFEQKALGMRGTVGEPTSIIVNHYEVQSLPKVKVFQYDVSVLPSSATITQTNSSLKPSFACAFPSLLNAVDRVRLLRIKSLKSCTTPLLGRISASILFFDGAAFCFFCRAKHILTSSIGVSLGWSVNPLVPVEKEKCTTIDLPGHKPEKPNQVDISLRCTGPISIVTLVQYMNGATDLNPMGNPAIEPLLKWLNAVYRQDPASRWVTRPNANAYYDRTPETSMPLKSTGGVLEAIRGVYQTMQIRFGRLTMNVDTATTAFYTPDKSFIELLHATSGVPPSANIQAYFLDNPGRFFNACGRLLGIYFNVRHLSDVRNARKIKFQKWSRADAIETVFEREDRATGNKTTTNVLE